MTALQKTGGISALVAAATFLIGLVMFATVLIDYTTGSDPREAVAFLVDHQFVLYAWNLIITIIFGIVLVPVVLALRERLAGGSSVLNQTAAVFGLIWSGLIIATGMIVNVGSATIIDLDKTDPEMAATVWSAVDSVANGLGGGNEVVGGLWVLLLSIAALGAGVFPKTLNYLGVVSGVAGLVTVVPGLEDVGAVFGLGLIVWFTWIGIALLRSVSAKQTAAERPMHQGTGRI